MKASPVKRYGLPRYPTRLEVQSNPGLLRRNIPPGWRAVPEMTGAVALFLAVNTSICRGADKKGAPGGAAMVAPIFEHGAGRGAIGCIVVAPPVFMSEEEALQVVREELRKSGVELSEKGRSIKGTTVPLAEYFSKSNREAKMIRPREGVKERKPFQVDGADPKKRVAVEFVSASDFTERCGHSVKHADGMSLSSVQDYETKELAKFVAGQVKQEGKEKVYFGTFYDPLADKGPGQQPVESKRLLRLQVQDFVNWLKAQGAI
jgi:hypothetical protein